MNDDAVVFSWTDKLEGLALPKETLQALKNKQVNDV